MELQRRLIWAYEQFDKTVVLEHIAFPVVLITGLLMFFMAGWSIDSQWLLIKLVIVIGFFILWKFWMFGYLMCWDQEFRNIARVM